MFLFVNSCKRKGQSWRLVSCNYMKLTKEIRDKISDAWQYNSAGSCRAAMAELDKVTDALLRSNKVEIDEENIVLNNLSEFIIWKNKKWDLGQIPILTNKDIIITISLVNKLIADTKAQRIKFIETDQNNRRFEINIISDDGQFRVQLGNVKNFENLPCYTFNIELLMFDFIADKKYELSYLSKQFKTNKQTITFDELEIK